MERDAMRRVKQRPLYLLAREEIRRYIQDHHLKDGDMLPPEGRLCEQLGISRGTLREAMRALEEEEEVTRKQGIGTFVIQKERLISSTLDLNEGVSEMIQGKGMAPGAKNSRMQKVPADPKLSKALDLEVGAPVIVVKRLRTANDIPVAYTEDYIPEGIVPESIKLLQQKSLYELLEYGLGIELASSLLKLKPVKATKALAEELGIKKGDLLVFLQQTDVDITRRPVLYSEEYFVSDRFEFVVVRKRKKNFAPFIP
jgi:GntR family transcriptional regulator